MSSSRQEQVTLWMRTAIINGLGWSISFLIVQGLVKNPDPYLGKVGLMSSTETIVLWLLAGCFAGYILGVFQGLSAQGFKSGRWPLTTMAGLGLAYSGYEYLVVSQPHLDSIAFSLVFGVLLGGLVGWLQWLILRRHYSRAGWWLPANIIIWVLGVTSVFARQLGSLGGVSLIAVGAVTGLAVLWLLRHPLLSQTAEEAASSIASGENSGS